MMKRLTDGDDNRAVRVVLAAGSGVTVLGVVRRPLKSVSQEQGSCESRHLLPTGVGLSRDRNGCEGSDSERDEVKHFVW